MLKFFRWLLTGDGNAHQWVIINRTEVYDSERDSRPVYRKLTLQCKHCGNIKVKKV